MTKLVLILIQLFVAQVIGDDIDGMPNLAEMPQNVDEFINSGISIDYVPEWTFKEGLRELIQNAVDAMATFMIANDGSKSDWKVVINEHIYDNIKYRTFDFTWPEKKITIGRISYDPIKQELLLENPGSMERYNLLLGGSGSIKRQNKLIN